MKCFTIWRRLTSVSALSGESILGPRKKEPGASSNLWFQHSLVSLFWGHQYEQMPYEAISQVSALSGESILGPLEIDGGRFILAPVSALSGESILGPPAVSEKGNPTYSTFQHSLVSLFWGHAGLIMRYRFMMIVSALSGESILGPPQT